MCKVHSYADVHVAHAGFPICVGFRMTAHRDFAAGTGAVVGKPPMKEPAGRRTPTMPRAMAI
jgi:hypothetical protein